MRSSSPTMLAVSSLLLLGLLAAALAWREWQARPTQADRPLIVYAAPTGRLRSNGSPRITNAKPGSESSSRFGASEDILTKVRFPSPVEPADLFIPADDSYVRQARELGFAAESIPIARVKGVLLLAKQNPKQIATWNDLLRDGVKVAVPNPAAAVGKVARMHLTKTGKWSALEPRVIDTGTVTEAANATKAGGVDAAIVWDAVAHGPAFAGQTVLMVPELDGVDGRIEVAVLKQSRDPDVARRFARYIAAPDRGLVHFREFQFLVEDKGETWSDGHAAEVK